MTSLLEGLARHSVIVADTGDLAAIERYRPRDATTNPSLILKAAQDPRYRPLVDAALREPAGAGEDAEAAVVDALFVAFGREILERVPGRVSTEVEASLSFDAQATGERARRLIARYEASGVGRERVLIKIASTWEGIRAAAQLEREGIRCNLTLLFSFVQAAACADAGVTLISPFVGRIYDWHRRARGGEDIPREQDPGVASVRRIYEFYRKAGYATEIMGASFRRTTQVLDLAGCDLLTISPELLRQLADEQGEVTPRLTPAAARASDHAAGPLDEASFRWRLNEDAMATEKLAEGIRAFHADLRQLLRHVAAA